MTALEKIAAAEGSTVTIENLTDQVDMLAELIAEYASDLMNGIDESSPHSIYLRHKVSQIERLDYTVQTVGKSITQQNANGNQSLYEARKILEAQP